MCWIISRQTWKAISRLITSPRSPARADIILREFKKATGQSPHRYVSARRVERAKILLRSDRSLVEIALPLSFSSQANFTRAFTKATGQAPGRYRRELGPWYPDVSLTDTRQGSGVIEPAITSLPPRALPRQIVAEPPVGVVPDSAAEGSVRIFARELLGV
jgi:hypothetical protein